MKRTNATYQQVGEAGIHKVFHLAGVLLELSVLLQADVVEDVLANFDRRLLDLVDVPREERLQAGEEVHDVSGVDVPKDVIEVLHYLLEVVLLVLELLGAHVPAEDVHGAEGQDLLGIDRLTQHLVELQRGRGPRKLLPCVT